jgi:hypothetical protein
VKAKGQHSNSDGGSTDSGRGISLKRCKKERIIHEIAKEGCDMLRGKLDGNETKEEIVGYLKHCDCPALKKRFYE